jgi:Raf kinase inhibitor-like YbhB/YbcL family protein
MGEGSIRGGFAMTRIRAIAAIAAIVLAGCSAGAPSPTAISSNAPSPTSTTPSPEPAPGDSIDDVAAAFAVTSTDFVDGATLDAKHSANAWGQCSGPNLNPQLSWSGAPDGTATYAIVVFDRAAGNYVHWVHANIPASVTSVGTGGSGSLPGVAGTTSAGTEGYFGPCPPGPNHRYEFVVYALDAELALPSSLTYPSFFSAAKDHILAQASITGMFSPVG